MAKRFGQLRGRVEWWVPALFALFSGLWIYGSDRLVAAVALSIEQQRVISTYKGFGYVFVATVLLHIGMRAALRRERAEAERVLEARHLNEQIIQGALEGIIVYDRELRYQVWNPFMEQLSGVPASTTLGKRAVDVFPFLKDAGLLDRLQRNLAGEVFTDEIDFQVTRPGNGQGRWASNMSASIRDAQGQVTGVLAFVRDITARKQSQEALAASEARFRALFESAPLPTWEEDFSEVAARFRQLRQAGVSNLETHLDLNPGDLLDLAARIRLLHVNAASLTLLGARSMAELTLDLPNRLLEESLPAFRKEMVALFEGKTTFETEIPILSIRGERIDLHLCLSVVAGHEQDLGLVLVSFADITERNRSDRALRESESLLRTVMENTPDVIMGVDRDGCIQFINQLMPGLTHAMVLGTHITQWVPEEERALVTRCLEEAFSKGRPSTYESRGPSPDSGPHWFSVRLQPVMVDGKAESVIYTAADITDRRRAEEERRLLEQQLARTQKLESLGSLAGGVAHDMNNVLGAILSLASLHQMREDIDPALRQNIDTIAKACLRGRTLVQGLLGFARKGVAEERLVDLNQLVREEVSLLEHTTLKKMEMVTELAEDLAPVKGDPAALSHALMNLCINAVDAMPDGGQLVLRTRNAPAGQVRLEVSDTGSGMTKETLDKAVDPFFTTKPQGKGTGLGLSIVYGTVKAHRGQLEIRSSVGQGTTVEISLPAAVGPTQEGPVSDMTVKASRKLRVLLVDDDELIQDSTAQVLEAIGHAPTVAGRGEEALATLEAGLACDVVILDLNMPGMGGAVALTRIRALRPELPILLATGRADEQALELVQTVPLVTLMAKPFAMLELRQRLEAIDPSRPSVAT